MKEEEKALKFMRKYIERVFQNYQVVATDAFKIVGLQIRGDTFFT